MSDLSDVLETNFVEPPIEDEQARAAFVVDDDSKATWAARKLARYEAEIERCEQQAKDEKQRIDEWLDDATSGARNRAKWFADLLAGYAVLLHDADPQCAKTHKFIGGEVGRRKQPDKVEVVDEKTFVEWALVEHDDLLKITPSLTAIKGTIGRGFAVGDTKLVDDSGEIIPGVEFVAGVDKFFGKSVPR